MNETEYFFLSRWQSWCNIHKHRTSGPGHIRKYSSNCLFVSRSLLPKSLDCRVRLGGKQTPQACRHRNGCVNLDGLLVFIANKPRLVLGKLSYIFTLGIYDPNFTTQFDA